MIDWQRMAQQEQQVRDELDALCKGKGPKDYLRDLEANYVTAMLNWQFALDEVIRLRRDNALLKLKKASRRASGTGTDLRRCHGRRSAAETCHRVSMQWL